VRVLEVCQPTVEGVAVHVEFLASTLPDRGVEVTVACPPGPLADHLRSRGVPWLPVPMQREVRPREDLAAIRQLARTLRAARRSGAGFDLVHAHSAKAGAVARVAALVARVPAVYTPHAWSFLAARGRVERVVYRQVERLLTFACRRIICVSRAERELGRAVGAERKCVVVPNGVEAPAVPTGGSGQDGRVVVGTVGRLAPQKGIDLLLQAAELVRRERPEASFRIAGDGPLAEQIHEEARRRGLADHVRFDGLVDGPWGVLAQLDVFVLPSRWEGMPFTLLEAMSCGLPVVSFDVGGVTDLIPDEAHGAVVAPGDVRGFADAILRFVDSPETRGRVGAAARRRVLEEFTLDRMIERTHEVYRDALEVDASEARSIALPRARRN
jgi:glycosyltransferase involved in cell wall biosynthesis